MCLLPKVRARVGDKAQELEDKERRMPLPPHRVVMAGIWLEPGTAGRQPWLTMGWMPPCSEPCTT